MISLRTLNEDKFKEFKDELFSTCGLILIRIKFCVDSMEYFYEFENLGYPKENFTTSEFDKDSPTRNLLIKIEEYYETLMKAD
jgi:hypothetical protein